MSYSSTHLPNQMFTEIYQQYDFNSVANEITTRPFDENRFGQLLNGNDEITLNDFYLLLSPEADRYLEIMAQRAQAITRQRFGNVILLYAPLYLSNECRSSCSYCGFSFENKTPRLTMQMDDIIKEAELLYNMGIRHILLLTGEDKKNTPIEMIAEAGHRLSQEFSSVGIEIYPVSSQDYRLFRNSGIDSLVIYQETYDPVKYSEVHRRGLKKRLAYRLETPDRAGEAGLRRINIGALLGLSSEPAAEIFFLGLHARYLMKRYWQSQLTISLPRLRPARGFSDVPRVADRDFVRYLIALRLLLPDVGLVLSTRENESMRNHLADICVTTLSAASRTDPGGYSERGAGSQFSINDTRNVQEMVTALKSMALEPVFVDWNLALK